MSISNVSLTLKTTAIVQNEVSQVRFLPSCLKIWSLYMQGCSEWLGCSFPILEGTHWQGETFVKFVKQRPIITLQEPLQTKSHRSLSLAPTTFVFSQPPDHYNPLRPQSTQQLFHSYASFFSLDFLLYYALQQFALS